MRAAAAAIPLDFQQLGFRVNEPKKAVSIAEASTEQVLRRSAPEVCAVHGAFLLPNGQDH